MNPDYLAIEPARAEIDALEGPALLEFGAPWCGYCRAAQPLIAEAMANHPRVHHIKVEDGKGRALARIQGEALANADFPEAWQGNSAAGSASQ